MRHAKSAWDEGVGDFDRGLNKRGLRDAPMIGEKLREMGIKPDIILSSPAKRAKLTAQIVKEKIGYKGEIVFVDRLYKASLSDIKEMLTSLSDEIDSVLLFGHNPSLTLFIDRYSNFNIDNIPTAGVVALSLDEDWSDIKAYALQKIFYIYPKMYKR